MHCIKGWVVSFAALLWLSACGGNVDGGDSTQSADDDPKACEGAACIDASVVPSKPIDAGTKADAGSVVSPPPSGHAPSDMAGCLPHWPEPSGARQILYPGPSELESMRSLWQVSTRSQGLFVADEQQGIFRVTASNAFERVVMAKTHSFLDADLGMYFVQNGSLFKVPLSGTDAMPSEVATGVTATPAFLTYDEENLYFADQTASTLVKLTISSGAQTVLQSSVHAADMTLHAGDLYYSDRTTQQIYRLSTDGGDPDPLTAGDSTLALAIAVAPDSKTLYFVDGTQILSTPLDGKPERNALGQAGPALLGRGWITRMKLQDDRLYWADDVGNIGWTATDGGACGLLLRGTQVPNGWDVDDSALYVTMPDTAHDSELWRIPLAP